MNISPKEVISQAFDSLWLNRFRSALTILGIVIGITTVVTVGSLLTGLRSGIVTFFEEFGPDNIFATRANAQPGGGSAKERRRRPMRPEYADRVAALVPSLVRHSVAIQIPQIIAGRAIIARVPGFESDNVRIVGQTAAGFEVAPKQLLEGRVFTTEEAARGDRVAVVGNKLAETLFPGTQASGKVFNLDGAEYLIVGVFEGAKGGFFGENPADTQATIPLRAAELRYPGADEYILTFQAQPGRRAETMDEIRAAMRIIRKLAYSAEDDFGLTTADQIVAQIDSILRLLLLVSIAISGLGLLVGGVGVMNIMLVSVTERTKEIGIRKAVGARRGDIILQFLIEAVTLTGVGGLIGIVFSVSVVLLIGALVPSLPSSVPPIAVASGIGVSMFVGIFFGVWPAVKAARLDPVEALRYE